MSLGLSGWYPGGWLPNSKTVSSAPTTGVPGPQVLPLRGASHWQMPEKPFKKTGLFPTHAPSYWLTSMKEKSSTLFAGQGSGRGSPSIPSVDSKSVLDWSTLVLLWSLEQLCWSPTEVASVWEDSEDKQLLGSCFRADRALLSGDGDSGARLRERKEGRHHLCRRLHKTEFQVEEVAESGFRL